MDVAVLKADLKAWERDFHLKKGRKPTKHDIKEDPISAKYKLHKQLHYHPKNSPPVEKSPSKAYLKSKSRPVESSSTSISQLSNPFSPKKPKPEYKDCFTTPKKQHTQSSYNREPSLESVIDATELESQKLHLVGEAFVEHSLDNARKRLRGEPITPSLHRDLKKKRRISVGAESSGHALLTATEYKPDLDMTVGLEDLNESPVKRQSGKYRPLFEDQYTKPSIHTNSNLFTRTRLVNEVSNMECDQDSIPPQTSPVPPSEGDKELTASPNTLPQFPYTLSPSSPSPKEGADGRQLLSPSPEPALEEKRGYSGSKKGYPGGEKAIASDESKTVEIADWVPPRRQRRGEEMENPEVAPAARLLVHAMTDAKANEVVVQLPDQIKHVLSLKDAEYEAAKRDGEAQGLLDRLMRGRHTASNGAHVWQAGEWAGADDQDGSEDDWEGQGLEWASGEL